MVDNKQLLTEKLDLKIGEIFKNRIASAPVKLIRSIANTDFVSGKIWHVSDYVLLSALPVKLVSKHQKFERKYSTPYPGLIETQGRPAGFKFSIHAKNSAMSGMSIAINQGSSAIWLDAGSSMYMENANIINRDLDVLSYHIDLIFIVRNAGKGSYIDLVEAFEALISIYISKNNNFEIEYV